VSLALPSTLQANTERVGRALSTLKAQIDAAAEKGKDVKSYYNQYVVFYTDWAKFLASFWSGETGQLHDVATGNPLTIGALAATANNHFVAIDKFSKLLEKETGAKSFTEQLKDDSASSLLQGILHVAFWGAVIYAGVKIIPAVVEGYRGKK
jgi:hypothetical protein